MISLTKAARILLALIIVTPAAARLRSQSQSPTNQSSKTLPKFDAISIKLHNGGPNLGLNLGRAGGHIQLTAGLTALMILTYDLHNLSQAQDTIVGMPNWAVGKAWDIEAEAPGNPTIEQRRLMLQSMLAERFKMVAHHETRQLPVYALVVIKPGKLGPQLHADAADTSCAANAPQSLKTDGSPAALALQDLQQFPCGRVAGGFLSPGDHVQVWSGGRNVNMDAITSAVGGMEYMDHPVVNRTGLAGDFDYTVEWDSRTDTEDFSASAAHGPVETFGNSLLEAMRDQLGLKLDLQKGPVNIIVIDHIEEPSPN